MVTTTKFKPSVYQQALFDRITDTRDSIIVNAVAGSGKTTSIVEAASLISPMESSAFLAFNKHIATELQQRLPDNVRASTFHSLGMAACRRNLPKVDVDKNKYWNIAKNIADNDWTLGGLFSSLYPLIQLIDAGRFHRCKLTGRGLLTVAERQGLLGIYAAGDIGWDRVAAIVKCCLQVGVKQALSAGRLDFTDMIWLTMFKRWDAGSFDNLFIDEVQDLNRLQIDFAMSCLSSTGRVVAVGDPHQAIYAFMGAMSNSFQVVKECFEAVEMPLSICYRCPTSHLDIARRFCPSIEPAPNAIEGTVDRISVSSLVTELKDRDDALLVCRKKAPLLEVCIDLLTSGVPATIRSSDVIDGVKKLLTLLEKKYKATYETFPAALDAYLADKDQQISETYGDRAEAVLESIQDEADALDSLYEGFPECKSLSALGRKLDALTKGDGVILSTIHGAKGLEAEWVGILYWEYMPLSHPHMTDDQRAQEENLQLIATTRSTKHLRFVE